VLTLPRLQSLSLGFPQKGKGPPWFSLIFTLLNGPLTSHFLPEPVLGSQRKIGYHRGSYPLKVPLVVFLESLSFFFFFSPLSPISLFVSYGSV